MGLSKENAEKLKWLWEDGHEAYWIETFVKIVDKENKLVPFTLTKQQKDFTNNMGKFNCVLKSRQLGFSVVAGALALRESIVKPYSNCLLVSNDQKSTNAIFNKLKIMYNSLPAFLKPKELANNRQELKLENGSIITCITAGNGDIVGNTCSFIHLSEFSRWKNPESKLASVTKMLTADGRLIIESTARGINLFHDLYFAGKRKENNYRTFFFDWITGRELFEKDYVLAVERYKETNKGKELTEDELDDEERELMKLGADLPQLMFRRLEVSTNGIEQFRQDRPSNDVEAFLNSGSGIFDTKRINQIHMAIKADKVTYIPKNNIVDLPTVLKNHYGRSFFIWKLPKAGKRYFIGVDTSLGVSQDYSVVEVFSEDGEQVAEFYNNKLIPFQFADIVNEIGRYYNKGILVIETAGGGGNVIERTRYTHKYMNMLKYKTYDEKNKLVLRLGFDTKTKRLIAILSG